MENNKKQISKNILHKSVKKSKTITLSDHDLNLIAENLEQRLRDREHASKRRLHRG